jgi:hypothetical protein
MPHSGTEADTRTDTGYPSAVTDLEIDGSLGHSFLQHFAVRLSALVLSLGLAQAP